ncbi:phosphoribosylglycinamide formyltransferase [Cohaesibacter gelatinilyticus]|uniref:Phosphoribosylglycinamide formyltransferase n=1 Tax=Cohaesibacter gelatinilyticus TaxID=372072 RepID=A0A285NJJ2_9HYPH|nr:phosphoribosylglycinamide formyltransferase [Cohaesibacter gelatinilyticus]SNZ08036.1 phosphoribosylglycinamide formyltransferase-1 [Cohaesibacter gelatinilyticus]
MASPKKRVAILISGRGSNMTAILDAAKASNYPADIALVLANKPDAKGLETAADHGIATEVVDHRNYKGDRSAFDAQIQKKLEEHKIELVVLAGFMRILTAEFVGKWTDKMINIHPSLLPSFKGLNTHQRAIDTGCRLAGCSVHFVRADMDSGPIICQAAVPVLNDDTADSLAGRILKAEHKIYPRAVALVAGDKVLVDGMRVRIKDDGNNLCATEEQQMIF